MDPKSNDRLRRMWPEELVALPLASFVQRNAEVDDSSGVGRRPVDVMISHSSKDGAIAAATCACLEARGLRCWIAPRDIVPGEEWGAAIMHGISAARVMVLIYSANSNESVQVRREVERAVSRRLFVIPLRVQDVPMSPALEYFISTPHWLDALSTPLAPHLERLAVGIRTLMGMTGERRQVPVGGPMTAPVPAIHATPTRARGAFSVALCLLGAAAAVTWHTLRGPR